MKKKRSEPAPFDSTSVIIDPGKVDYTPKESGYNEALGAKMDTPEALRDAGAQDFDFHAHLWIEPSLWKDHARDNDKYETWAENWRTHFTHQGNSHECVCHSFTQWFETTWNRQAMTRDHCVWFSPLSLYAEANPRKWGGTYLNLVLQIARSRGVLPEHNGPDGIDSQKQKFSHTLHQTAGHTREGGGPWVPLSKFPQGWKETARHFRPHEVINISSWQQIICCLLQGYPVWVGRRGHAVPYTFVVWDENDRIFAAYPDSYEVIRYDSLNYIKASVPSAMALATTTLPNDWTNPTD